MPPGRDILKCLAGLLGAGCGSEGVVPSLGVSLVASLGAKSITISCVSKRLNRTYLPEGLNAPSVQSALCKHLNLARIKFLAVWWWQLWFCLWRK